MKYKVSLYRYVTDVVECDVEVEAENEEGAREAALDLDAGELNFEFKQCGDSGPVQVDSVTPVEPRTFESLDAFTKAYITTALWSSNDESTDDGGEPFDQNYGLEDIAPEALERMAADCAQFQTENAGLLASAIESGEVVCGPDFDEMGRAGHDFWLTRNGHGAGFWDGDWPQPYADNLATAAQAYPEVNLTLGDDGKIYCG